jgi:hypothetical protein
MQTLASLVLMAIQDSLRQIVGISLEDDFEEWRGMLEGSIVWVRVGGEEGALEDVEVDGLIFDQ